MTPELGIAAAVASSASWALAAVLWRRMGDEISPYSMNLAKGLIGGVYLAAALAASGAVSVGAADVLSLGLSGVLGIALGDTFYFMSLVSLGPRLATLLGSLSPILTALLAMMLLGERPAAAAWLGIFLAVGGAAWVMREKTEDGRASRDRTRGTVSGLVGVLCMALGTILAKKGAAAMPAVQAALVRVGFGVGALLLWGAVQGRAREGFAGLGDARRLARLCLIVLVVTFGGFWLSLVALKNADAWLVSIILSTVPLFVLPLAALMFGERISARAVLGTLTAVGGVVLACAGR